MTGADQSTGFQSLEDGESQYPPAAPTPPVDQTPTARKKPAFPAYGAARAGPSSAPTNAVSGRRNRPTRTVHVLPPDVVAATPQDYAQAISALATMIERWWELHNNTAR